MRVQSTLEVSRALGVPEWRLARIIRNDVIEPPPLVAGRRVWSLCHIHAAEAALRQAGVLASAEFAGFGSAGGAR